MKTKHFLFATLLAVILTGCYDDDKLWDAVNQQTARIEALESWQKETNSNIQALQTLVSTQDYITQVTPVTLGGDTVGYTIAFKNSKSISIYHGQKGDTGEKGEAGIAGTVPTISATQEADGNWYWTLNGALMKDASGNPVRANGQTGPAAPTPLLKTGKELTSQGTSGHWIADAAYLSVDNGNSWTKVSGDDGKDGSNGSNGDSMFSKVTTFENEGYIAFRLSNGKEFKVPIYKAFALSFSYKSSPNEKLDLNSEILITNDKDTISYNIEGKDININNVKVSATIADGDNWKLKIDRQNKIITFTSSSIGIANLSITATDNAGHYCNYQLTLKRETLVGKGTDDDPYTVSTPQELQYLARRVNAGTLYSGDFFELSNDIDLTGIEWIPIGTLAPSFQGTFDGKGHAIRGLKVDQDSDYGGLFGGTDNATLKNITLISPKVEISKQFCGSLVGYSRNATIENCNVTDGYCSARETAGGLIGTANRKTTITNCHVKNTKVTANFEIGGLIGRVNSFDNTCDVTNCSATGCELTAQQRFCGGLIGIFSTTTLNLTACYATGSIVSPNDRVGALLGVESGSSTGKSGHVTMTGCYSTIPDPNNVGSFTLQGGKSANGTSTCKACYYITSQPAGTATGVTVQPTIDATMIANMNTACGQPYYKLDGTLETEP